ncbi:thiolase family protein [Novosphingobium taihuense]|uniref:propanoyl-CoA C-acyltransferase n=1 Tax=Novosphingobium taihuense TaxID=260085 RepID=A0A7W7EWH7_9SPHN|nr:thiolase family protein [Novosphingobium taihuense]MBB4614300.1 acetyl-CoA acetyltransferase [Novosphingobium taihuense]TWH87147.1 acetyl-CoA acetyltransferase [Novosphingobium taihuense]
MSTAEDIFIVGSGMTSLGKFPDMSVRDMTAAALSKALDDSGLADPSLIEAAWFGNTRQALLEGQNGIRGEVALRKSGVVGIPITNVENACASGSTGFFNAVNFLKAGAGEVALAIGCEKMFFPENRNGMFAAFRGSTDVLEFDSQIAQLLSLAEGMPIPEGVEPAAERSVFMDIYAAFARYHMARFGTTQRQIAAVAAKNHYNSTMNPDAQYRFDMSVDAVLADKPVSWPFTRSMCAPISDGAAAMILCTGSALKRFNKARAVPVAACALVSASDRQPDDLDNHIGRRAAVKAYEMAGVGPEVIRVAEVHDATAFAEILQIENLGLCPRGEGGPFTEAGETRINGRVAVNPSGGLLSKGHPVGATGIIQLHELVTQLRGEAGQRQVANARFAAAENGGGFLGYEEAATVVTILGGA